MRMLLLIALLGASLPLLALEITEAEYFIDTDPGAGNGTAVTIVQDDQTGFYLLQVPTTGLQANQTHYLYTRFRSEEGPWSMTERRPFFLYGPPVSTYEGRSITQLEYWFDSQAPVGVDVVDNDFVNYAALIPTSGLALNVSHKFSVRYIDNTGKLSGPEARYFFLHQDAGGGISIYDITHVEYHFDDDPPTLVDLTDGTFQAFADSIPTTGLALNMTHKLSIRYLDERGLWSQPEARYFFIHRDLDGSVTHYNITHMEYRFDLIPPILMDISDGMFTGFDELIFTGGLSVNVSHKLTVRYLDERGLWSQPEARYFFLHEEPGSSPAVFDITHVEVWFDTLTHSLIDIADAVNINFADSIPHNLTAGPHHFRLRYRDERGLISNTESRPFFVWTGAGPGGNSRLAGAEYFVNVDPGVGNGVQIEFPDDGTWDERNETIVTELVGVPTGLHLFGIRFKDELDNWSITLLDTFVVGPVLMIHVSGNDIVLNWIANPDHHPFRVYRADTWTAPYVQIAETDSLFYTDAGVLSADSINFYHVTVNATTVSSSFRLPPAAEEAPIKW